MQKKIHFGCIIGTRPEMIKMMPVISLLQHSAWAKVTVINTAQHRSLLDDMLHLFHIKPDFDLNSMVKNQTLSALTANLCQNLEPLLHAQQFDALLAAGDTTTVFISALTAFYNQIPFGHIEAGLRTHNPQHPFPEEINRVLTAPLTTWHFVPTEQEKNNLLQENIAAAAIIVSGNPVIDTLLWTLNNTNPHHQYDKTLITVTTHRRENFGDNLHHICQAILELSVKYPQAQFVIPVHPNPNVEQTVFSMLGNKCGIELISPLPYDAFVHLMAQSTLILTDSGGIQEEAPALGKPVLVLRDETERPAIIEQGMGLLVGTEKERIINTVANLLDNQEAYSSLVKGTSPYGDGTAGQVIVNHLHKTFSA